MKNKVEWGKSAVKMKTNGIYILSIATALPIIIRMSNLVPTWNMSEDSLYLAAREVLIKQWTVSKNIL